MLSPGAFLSGSSDDRVFPPANVARKDMPAEEISRSKQSREVGGGGEWSAYDWALLGEVCAQRRISTLADNASMSNTTKKT